MIIIQKHRKLICNLSALFILFTLLLAVSSVPAFADQLADAKQSGLVGEKPDGYLGVVSNNAPADVSELVKNINSQRQAKYKEIAEQNKQSPEVVGSLMGEKLINITKEGLYYMTPDGTWVRK